MTHRIYIIIALALSCRLMATAQGRYVFPTEVPPIVVTEWGQEYPYNRKCPTVTIDSVQKHVYAGCGPLVMSQVIRSLRYPSASALSADGYDWELMPEHVTDTATMAVQDAVARLIRDCGTAAGTTYRQTASATKLNGVVTGLKKHFGYSPYMHIADRAAYRGEAGARAWKTLIYGELRAGRSVIIRGEKGPRNAHVFIIDGCRDSTVHVNWGWGGRRNGYYDPDSLYGFRAAQRMVVGIGPAEYRPAVRRIDVERPGALARHIAGDDWLTMHHLKLTGTLNRDDIRLLRRLAGGAAQDGRGGCLSTIDMSESVILTLPDSAFAGCAALTWIALPITLPEVGRYAFAGCERLNEVRMGPLIRIIRQRAFAGCFNLTGLALPQSLRTIESNAFNSCNSLTAVTLPPKTVSVGNGAFAYATQLSVLRIPKTATTLGTNITKGTKVRKITRI